MIRKAILTKTCMEAEYNGYMRRMCPQTLGISKKGEEQALFYQYAGESSKGLDVAGSPKNWRCMPVASLSGLRVIEGDWKGGPNHSQPQSCVSEVDVEAAY